MTHFDARSWLADVGKVEVDLTDRALASVLAVQFDARGQTRARQAELMETLGWSQDELRASLDRLQDVGLLKRTLRPFSVEVPAALLVDDELLAPRVAQPAAAVREVMDAEQVADYLGLAVSTIYKKVEYREIPYTKVGSLLRFPKWLVDRWLTKNAVRPRDPLFHEFVRLQRRYHLESFLEAQGLEIGRMSEEQLLGELRAALDELRDEDRR